MENMLIIFVVIFITFAIFVAIFIFKQIEFVLTAVNLYKKMIKHQDAMVKLLIDIRDNTKKYSGSIKEEESAVSMPFSLATNLSTQDDDSSDDENATKLEFCYYCGADLEGAINKCPKCGEKI